MKESTKTGLGVVFWICFVIGLLLFLTKTHSTGEALESLHFNLYWDTISIVGIILLVAALAALAVLFFPELKKHLRHK